MTNEEFIEQNQKSYTNEYANFPYSVLTIHNFKDVDDTVASIVNSINDAKNKGLYKLAENIANDNKDLIESTIINAENFRTWEEEIKNTQIMTKQKSQFIYDTIDEPDYCCVNDFWIGD